jgi:hypothetical protein
MDTCQTSVSPKPYLQGISYPRFLLFLALLTLASFAHLTFLGWTTPCSSVCSFSLRHNNSSILYIEFNPSNNLRYNGFYLVDKFVFSFADAALHNYFFLSINFLLNASAASILRLIAAFCLGE